MFYWLHDRHNVFDFPKKWFYVTMIFVKFSEYLSTQTLPDEQIETQVQFLTMYNF